MKLKVFFFHFNILKNLYMKNILIKKELIVDIDQTIKTLQKLKIQSNDIFIKLCNESIKAIKKNKKILFFGNGGSAADSQHLATEITVRFKKNRKALPAISLATDTSALTAISNDFNFEKIFSRQIEAVGNKGDIALGITTSGNSQNIIEACKVCKERKINFFAFSGNAGGKLKKYCKNIIEIPSNETSIIQTAEILVGQTLFKIIEKNLSKKKLKHLDLVILAGGLGSRIKDITKKKPKPLIKFGKLSFLKNLVNYLAKFNFNKIYIIAGYKGDLIKEEFHNKIINLTKIECILEKKLKGTGGALNELKKKIKNFILSNGDSFCPINLNYFIKNIKNKSIKVSLVKNKIIN